MSHSKIASIVAIIGVAAVATTVPPKNDSGASNEAPARGSAAM